MSEPALPDSPNSKRPASGTPSWRAYFHASTKAVFIIGASRRLRYANPAWEALTGRPLAKIRGMRISHFRSASGLGQTLMPPSEVWDGHTSTVRRALPDADAGPPWWDITFVPMPGESGLLGVVGFITEVGVAPTRREMTIPAGIADLRLQHALHYSHDRLSGASPLTARLLSQVRLAGSSTAPVWITGESGSGKSTIARVIHHNGLSWERAFFSIDGAAVQPYLIDSQLFGKGGLTTSPHLGTLYLHDPATLPRDLQEKIVTLVTQPGPNSPRLICSATRSAAELVKTQHLLPAFHTQLSALEITVPSLRDRLEDLPYFVTRLLQPANPEIADDLWPALRSYTWPGNLRELATVLQQTIAKAETGPITPDHLPRYIREKYLLTENPIPTPTVPRSMDTILLAVEKRLIELALHKTGNSQTDAAEMLGMFRSRLWRRVEALKISPALPVSKPRKKKGEPDAEDSP